MITDGGSVYSRPDFDSPVADYLSVKTPVWISKKAVPGHGGLGLFHKIRYKNRSGYMADTDIHVVEKEAIEQERQSERPKLGKHKKKIHDEAYDDEQEEQQHDMKPVYFTRMGGVALGLVNFTEKFSGHKLWDHMLMYGLRLTGPGTIFDGPPLDVNVWFSLQKPGYYNQVADNPVQGFLMFGDIKAMFPLKEWENALINFGAGMMWTYTNYKVATGKTGQTNLDSQEVRVGADFDLGAVYRFKPFAVRLDASYYWERTQYLGYIASFQMEY